MCYYILDCVKSTPVFFYCEKIKTEKLTNKSTHEFFECAYERKENT